MSHEVDLSGFPRFRLLDDEPTPLHPLDTLNTSLAEEGHHVRLFVKRDDLTPIGGGGNKLRKLEFILGDAIAKGADTIFTFGGLQSNHARLTAAAAAKAGLACELVLSRNVPRDDPDYRTGGNLLLDALFGATVHALEADIDAAAFARERMTFLRGIGRRPYLCPVGGSSPIGTLGYVACAAEIAFQARRQGRTFAEIVVANGSGGTQAGLAAGLALAGQDPRRVRGFAVLAPASKTIAGTRETAAAAAALLDRTVTIGDDQIVVDDSQLGPGYGLPTAEMKTALEICARREGLLLDPVYSGKAFAGLLQDVRAGRYADGTSVLFVMTGGWPGLFAYRSEFAG